MRILFIYLISMLVSTIAFAQTETDVMRYSSTHFGGSARYNGVAGAFGAVGADISVLSTNPAGMGRYRESEFSFTPSLTLSTANTLHNGVNTFDSRENININSVGIVGVSKAHANSTSKWRAAQFGFGYNKLMNFNSDYRISGLDSNSFSQVLAAEGYGATEDDLFNYNVSTFMAAPAYMAWLIDPLNGLGGKEVFTTQMYVDSIQKEHTVQQSGSLGEWSFAVSGNYNEKFYVGGSVNFQRFSYTQEKTHTEYSLIDTTALTDFTYSEFLNTEGRGFNLKIGAIYLPTKWLRIGLSYHSPTAFYKVTDKWNTSVETNFRNTTIDRTENGYFAESPRGSFLYKMRTPSRLMGSLAFVIKKKGLISVDYEMVNYSNGLLRSHSGAGSGYQFENENERVIQNFVASNNIRLGAEYRITNLWMLRGGVAYYQNGYNPEVVSQTTPRMTYAGGIGYRAREFYFDFAYTLTKSTEDYYMYDPILVSNALIQKRAVNLIATIGFKF